MADLVSEAAGDPGSLALPRPRGVTHPGLARAREQARLGQVSAALASLDALRRSGELDPDSADTALLVATTIDCLLARGELGRAVALGEELAPYLDLPGAPGAIAHHARGELASALNDPEVAGAHFTAAGERMASDTGHAELVPWRAGAALAAVRRGRRPEGAALARDQLALAGGSPYASALALRTLASAEGGGDRIALLRRARAALAGTHAARLAAQIDTDLAGLLLLAGDAPSRAEALTLLRDAEEYAGRQELWPLHARVRRLLERLGEGPVRVESEALDVLTVSERRVARLAAQGLTNRQIAGELEVTVKAVEWHLSHVYRKLGIRSRTRLSHTLGVAG